MANHGIKKIHFLIPTMGRPSLKRAVESITSCNGYNQDLVKIHIGLDLIHKQIHNSDFDQVLKTLNITDNMVILNVERLDAQEAGAYGGSLARNKLFKNICLEDAHNELIAMVDDDDYIKPSFINDVLTEFTLETDLLAFAAKYDQGTTIYPSLSSTCGHITIAFVTRAKLRQEFEMPLTTLEDFLFVRTVELSGKYKIKLSKTINYQIPIQKFGAF